MNVLLVHASIELNEPFYRGNVFSFVRFIHFIKSKFLCSSKVFSILFSLLSKMAKFAASFHDCRHHRVSHFGSWMEAAILYVRVCACVKFTEKAFLYTEKNNISNETEQSNSTNRLSMPLNFNEIKIRWESNGGNKSKKNSTEYHFSWYIAPPHILRNINISSSTIQLKTL